MAEFDLIRRLQEVICRDQPGDRAPVIGIGDDAAVLNVPENHQLVVTTDTLVEGTHFLAATSPRDVGHKALAVNLSDLAAMGAEPAWFFLSITLPEYNRQWLDEFAFGIAGLASEYDIQLAGGDTSSGPLSVTITAVGLAGEGEALTRSGAREGDLVAVSGTLGDASFALHQLKTGAVPEKHCLEALNRPTPRLELGLRLRHLATSCLDLSDGLMADLGHILTMSGVGAEIQLASVPRSDALASMSEHEQIEHQLTGGDDYELCFTFAPDKKDAIETIMEETGVLLTVIGHITNSGQLEFRTREGSIYQPAGRAYEHFTELKGDRS